MPQETKPKKSFFNFDISIGGTGLAEKALLAKYLAVMQQSGLTITESLDIIEETARGRMKKIITVINKSVASGNSLADSFGRFPKVFSGIFISAVFAGENSGTLAENLQHLSDQLQKEKELSSKIKGAMLYPIVVLIAAFILGMGMSFIILPKIIPLFEGLKTELPFTTRALISFSHFVANNTIGLVVGIILGVIALLAILKAKFSRPVTNWLLLKIPVVKGISVNTNLARFSRTLGTLLKSGLNIDEALEITSQTVSNYYYQKAFREIGERVSKGSRLAASLDDYKKLFPKMVTRMVMVGEQSGNLEGTLIYLAEFYEVEVDNATKNLSTAIEPILLLLIGLVVGFLALSIITPIYNITGNIHR
ncbi:MAG: FimO [Candidatus Magasanikbacteria bacterium GW2011_GWC2_37_14]|uniref:FimO n=1 Tax=Candidatus Magasanikbacteria bacterium GW2011_GWC2_37_14 TaxID=1619046 RepID=A0A0G0JHV8_9BACT|nr:MAG: FimO [Candidatus Magasanikbacteria bacterium GW2011_GWC2_37_14]